MAKRKILARLKNYVEFEYQRRCKRHAFYEEAGAGGLQLLNGINTAVEHLEEFSANAGGRGKVLRRS